ncbi:hypothetical protein F0562_021753 [Nyssa sinensis]|uniref:Cyclic nucleotide-binding domain-containing protein n=1 Tax=Nyssa sinensis TaxID=561372 RepID=A0A5J5BPL7_9ASTE|nr:hypothetical protein F0562_021753 [Nyssa sinensis]
MLQYLLRFSLIYPLSSQIVNATGVMTTETAWVGAAYNMMLYLLASHVAGTCFYLLTVERQQECWKSVCQQETLCEYGFFDCRSVDDPGRSDWLNSTNVTNLCVPSNTNTYYQFGIYGIALSNGATSSSFFQKFFYCLWIGIQALSSTGQTLSTSIFTGENIYAILVASLGLVLLALLIANMQRYLASVTARIEEWRLKRTDTEQWMHHRQLPHDLRQSVREYDQFKWVATQGVDEESLLNSLPADLQREIKCHLCLNLVRRMDDQMLDAICERLKPSLCTKDTLLLLEGDPVDEMVFIIRGHLDSYTTNGGRTGFFNSSRLGPGDFCGEELLTWALDQHHSDILPSSTCTVQAISEVEAFALTAEDLNFVASQFRRLHSKELVHKFRFYSHQWRTWAACYIQAAWRRYKRQKKLHELGTKVSHSRSISEEMELFAPKPGSGMDVYASRLLGLRRGKSKHFEFGSTSSNLSPSKEPAEQEFIVDEE